MSSAWLLPEHIADVLPAQARQLEELRRVWLDAARTYGYELVAPPLLEHLESLLSGTGHALDLNTFKLVDQLSGRTLGVRADTTPQVARIDAHLLNRAGVSRLCYCGPVLHTRPAGAYASREPLQLGAEIYGHAGLEADLEVAELALQGLQASGLGGLVIDLADVRVIDGVLAACGLEALNAATKETLIRALSTKDEVALHQWAQLSCVPGQSGPVTQALAALTALYGGVDTLDVASERLPAHPLIDAALADLRWLYQHLAVVVPGVRIGFDLSDVSGYAYYSGTRFAIYTPGLPDALVRGGRYDEVGAVFGRRRPAAGFSLDLKVLADVVSHAKSSAVRSAIQAPWSDDIHLRQVIQSLRQQGETVVCVLPGHEHDVQEFACDRELVCHEHVWQVRARL